MGLDLRDQIGERLVGIGHPAPLGERKVAKARRAEREIEARGDDRQPDQGHDRSSAPQAETALHRGFAPALVGGGQQPAADLDPRCVGLGSADDPGGHVAVDFGELVPVDHDFTAAGIRPSAAAERPQHGKDRRDRHQREHKPQRHQAVPGWNGGFPASRLGSALHYRRQARQLTITGSTEGRNRATSGAAPAVLQRRFRGEGARYQNIENNPMQRRRRAAAGARMPT
ncbi:hypothetical protein ACVW1C_001267 [Bradyrhizobium sp. USDA 4011]